MIQEQLVRRGNMKDLNIKVEKNEESCLMTLNLNDPGTVLIPQKGETNNQSSIVLSARSRQNSIKKKSIKQ